MIDADNRHDAWPAGLLDAALPRLAAAALSTRIQRLGPGERLTLIGIDRHAVADALRTDPAATRGALMLSTEGPYDQGAVADRLLDDLAALALRRWPSWYGSESATPDELARLAAVDPRVSRPWLKAATRRIEAGQPPRFRRAARSLELAQLLRAIDPSGLILIAAPDPVSSRRAAPLIQVIEWCAAQGAALVVAHPVRPPAVPPHDRVLYGAFEVGTEAEPVQARFVAPRPRAHHASRIEARVEAALRRDAELGPLFACNAVVPLAGLGLSPRVDLLWREGRIVVELDGPDHQGDPKFANDRHRDYELLVAGYLVLRITNDQVETDLQHAIEKIRAVVRFRRSAQGGLPR